MKAAIMQPYLFPYLGYFQLIRAVDTFVVCDDVNYIKGGWINRNFILSQHHPHRITMSLQNSSQNRLINQILVAPVRDNLLETIRRSYAKAPQYSVVFPLIEEILLQREENLACYLDHGLRRVCDYLGLRPQWHVSSAFKKENSLRGQEMVLAICEELGATHYINAPGGKELYNREDFAHRGMQLSFVQPKPVTYPQFGNPFAPNLSIIDVMMFNDQEHCGRLLEEYVLD